MGLKHATQSHIIGLEGVVRVLAENRPPEPESEGRTAMIARARAAGYLVDDDCPIERARGYLWTLPDGSLAYTPPPGAPTPKVGDVVWASMVTPEGDRRRIAVHRAVVVSVTMEQDEEGAAVIRPRVALLPDEDPAPLGEVEITLEEAPYRKTAGRDITGPDGRVIARAGDVIARGVYHTVTVRDTATGQRLERQRHRQKAMALRAAVETLDRWRLEGYRVRYGGKVYPPVSAAEAAVARHRARMADELWTTTEAAERLGVHRATTHRIAQEAWAAQDEHLSAGPRGYQAPPWWWQAQLAARRPGRPRKAEGGPGRERDRSDGHVRDTNGNGGEE